MRLVSPSAQPSPVAPRNPATLTGHARAHDGDTRPCGRAEATRASTSSSGDADGSSSGKPQPLPLPRRVVPADLGRHGGGRRRPLHSDDTAARVPPRHGLRQHVLVHRDHGRGGARAVFAAEVVRERSCIAALSKPLNTLLYGGFAEAHRDRIYFSRDGITPRGMCAVAAYSRHGRVDDFPPDIISVAAQEHDVVPGDELLLVDGAPARGEQVAARRAQAEEGVTSQRRPVKEAAMAGGATESREKRERDYC